MTAGALRGLALDTGIRCNSSARPMCCGSTGCADAQTSVEHAFTLRRVRVVRSMCQQRCRLQPALHRDLHTQRIWRFLPLT